VNAPVRPDARASLLQTLRLVAWSFMGIRSKQGNEQDMARINPLHIVLVALVAVLGIVVGLVALVHWVVAA